MHAVLNTARATQQPVMLRLADAMAPKGEWRGPYIARSGYGGGWFNTKGGDTWHGDRGQPTLVDAKLA